MLDIAYAGAPIQCAPEFCEVLAEKYEWRKRQTQKEAGNFKLMECVVKSLQEADYVQLAYIQGDSLPRMVPGQNTAMGALYSGTGRFIDMYDTLIFFRGGMYGEGAHDSWLEKSHSPGGNGVNRFGDGRT
ncbi:hypothetical protein BDQ17DRAFT_1424429 [Cyathus striatus]|nr:hypothetical protein BDQ17DRAFT_1424429 [Cyathus striatus]